MSVTSARLPPNHSPPTHLPIQPHQAGACRTWHEGDIRLPGEANHEHWQGRPHADLLLRLLLALVLPGLVAGGASGRGQRRHDRVRAHPARRPVQQHRHANRPHGVRSGVACDGRCPHGVVAINHDGSRSPGTVDVNYMLSDFITRKHGATNKSQLVAVPAIEGVESASMVRHLPVSRLCKLELMY